MQDRTFRAIDVGLSALKQYLVVACSRVSSAGFNTNSLPELLFANRFGAQSAEVMIKTYQSHNSGIWL